MGNSSIKAGIIGAGYIADWHADAINATPGVDLTCVCDVSPGAAGAFAKNYGIEAFTSVEDMITAGICDTVHILTPPHLHRDVALQCINAGLNVMVEKPVALSPKDTGEMVAAAAAANVQFGAGHNFLGLPSYVRLKDAVNAGKLGRISTAEINWCFPLGPLRAGPYGIWLMRDTRNLLLELGPHLYAFMVDLFGTPEICHLEIGKPVDIPGGGTRPQSWRIMARAGGVDVNINLSLVETYDDRSVVLRGSSAMARLDYANDTLIISGENTADLVINPLKNQMYSSWSYLREGIVNATRQFTSLNQKSPYGLSFRGTCAAFYDALSRNVPVDARFDGASAITVMQAIDDTLAHLPKETKSRRPKGTPNPTAMVIGGTGFIGRALTRALVAKGHDVRVLSRGKTGPFDDIANHVETVGVSLRDEAALIDAMQGIKHVFNLAKSMDRTWESALENDIGVSDRIARAAIAAGVKRFVYTGTIASYDMSDPDQTITENTGFATDMEDRNMYARSKAECENRLLQMHVDAELPLVIARPGIVVGSGGPLQHWGIGRWHGAGAVRIWGHGQNILPFVLIDDVVDGLIKMIEVDDAVGQSFNLIGERMLSARGYFDAIHDTLGAKIRVKPGALWAFYASDVVKFTLKTKILRRKGIALPSHNDWKSRAHFSPFDNTHPKQVLDWSPEANQEKFIAAAIKNANLLGF